MVTIFPDNDGAGVELDDNEDSAEFELEDEGVAVEPPSPQAATANASITRQSRAVQRVMRRNGKTEARVIGNSPSPILKN
jgi:hypothetical protein